MELKKKKETHSKKRKAAETPESPVPKIANTSVSSPPATTKPHLSTQPTSKATPSGFPLEVLSSHKAVEASLNQEPPQKKRKASIEEIEVDITKPEPPSKKALRRLKKGKPLPPPKSGAETTPEPEEEAVQKVKGENRSEHGIWIGNLPWSVTKADLRKFLTSNSEIADEAITRIHMPSPDDEKPANKVEETKPWKKQQYNKGFAYVDFSERETVPQAIELSEQLLSGRRVLIKDNKSFEGRPEKTKEETKKDGKPPNKRVFLGNLPFDTTEDSLKHHFERCGAIESAMVATFEDSGKCKGYAWLTFGEIEAAKNAVRGYVMVKKDESGSEVEESEESESDDDDEGGERKEAENKAQPKKVAMRKWWVNQIHKRPVRIEFAEDNQIRYKKRYGKDGTKSKHDVRADVGDNDFGDSIEPKPGKSVGAKEVDYRKPYAARLTGGIVQSKGKKVVF